MICSLHETLNTRPEIHKKSALRNTRKALFLFFNFHTAYFLAVVGVPPTTNLWNVRNEISCAGLALLLAGTPTTAKTGIRYYQNEKIRMTHVGSRLLITCKSREQRVLLSAAKDLFLPGIRGNVRSFATLRMTRCSRLFAIE